MKFADDTTVSGFITNNDEVLYRKQVDDTVEWGDDNDLILNIPKTKEMIIDFRKNNLPYKSFSYGNQGTYNFYFYNKIIWSICWSKRILSNRLDSLAHWPNLKLHYNMNIPFT